jgi:hypothetical protein
MGFSRDKRAALRGGGFPNRCWNDASPDSSSGLCCPSAHSDTRHQTLLNELVTHISPRQLRMTHNCLFSFFLPFFLSLTSFYLFIVCVVGFCCIWSHSDTSHSVGLLWMNDQPVAETSTWQHSTLTTDKHSCPQGFEPAIPKSERPQNHAVGRTATGIRMTRN